VQHWGILIPWLMCGLCVLRRAHGLNQFDYNDAVQKHALTFHQEKVLGLYSDSVTDRDPHDRRGLVTVAETAILR